MKALFRSLAAAFQKAAPAQAVAGVLLLALSLYTGYQIPKPSMIGALRWISFINVSPDIHHKPRASRFLRNSLSDTLLKLSWGTNSTLWMQIALPLYRQVPAMKTSL